MITGICFPFSCLFFSKNIVPSTEIQQVLSQRQCMLIDYYSIMENNSFSSKEAQNQKFQIKANTQSHHSVLRLDHSSYENYKNWFFPYATQQFYREQRMLRLHTDEFQKLSLNELSGFNTRHIVCLCLKYCPIYRRGVRQIVQCDFSNIRQIFLHHCLIDDEGAAELAKGSWAQLQVFELDNNPFSDRGHKFLSAAYWPNIRKLQVSIDKNSLNVLRQLLRRDHSKRKHVVDIELDCDKDDDIIYCFKYIEIGFFAENKSVYYY